MVRPITTWSSLRDDMLRPFQPPLKEFWDIIDTDTFTIPHNPIRPLRAFAFHDDVKRPLLEIYQGLPRQPDDGGSSRRARAWLPHGIHRQQRSHGDEHELRWRVVAGTRGRADFPVDAGPPDFRRDRPDPFDFPKRRSLDG